MPVLLDTDLLPARDRTEALHATYADVSPRRVVAVRGHTVRHRIERVDLGPERHLLRTGGAALEIIRTARHVRSDAPEYVAIGFHRHGETLVSTAGSEAEVPVGHLNCVDVTRPYRFVHRTDNQHEVLILSNRQLGVSVDVVRAAAAALARSPVYDLARGHLAGLFAAAHALPTEGRHLVGTATTGLVRALLTTAAEAQGAGDAMENALEARIMLYLDGHLADPGLSAERVARLHNISLRHFYDVWSRTGHDRTPMQWIVERRLQRAGELLRSLPAESITAIARGCGFSNVSHFSRRFRASFGVSPREWRDAQRRLRIPEQR